MVEGVLETNACRRGAQQYWFNGLMVYRFALSQPILPNMEPKSIGFTV